MPLLSRVIKFLPTGSSLNHVLQANKVQVYKKGQGSLENIVNEQVYKRKRYNPFYIIDIGAIVDQYLLWNTYLPKVHPYYAAKCCYSDILLQTLAGLGTGFDAANKHEIELIRKHHVPNDKIIFANPIKQVDHLSYAKDLGIKLMTFDNPWELDKIKEVYPDAELVLRIKTVQSNVGVAINFSLKFGCPMADVKPLLEKAKKLELNVVGVSFHAGYRCEEPCYYTEAIRNAKEVFNMAEQMGYKMRLLDIGGGYPGYINDTATPFEIIAAKIYEALYEHFGNRKDITIISEPGRFFAARSHTLVVQVIGKSSRSDENGQKDYRYYLNDGFYGSFHSVHLGDPFPNMHVLNPRSKNLHVSTLFGPTCDSLDHIGKNHLLPELEVGDWLYFDKFGAYSIALSTYFNCTPNLEYEFVFREDSLENLEKWEKKHVAQNDLARDQDAFVPKVTSF